MADFIKFNGYFVKDAQGRNLIANETSSRIANYNSLNTKLNNLISEGLVPYAVDSTSEMVNQKRIYVLKSTGKWYYYDSDNSIWTIGGDYQAGTTAGTLSAVADTKYGEYIDISSLDWTIGGVSPDNHNITAQTDRIRSTTVMRVKAGSVITCSSTDDYEYKVTMYKHIPKFYYTFIEEHAFTTGNPSYTIPYDCYIVITIKTTDASLVEEDETGKYVDIVSILSSSKIYLNTFPVPAYGCSKSLTETYSPLETYVGYRWNNSMTGYVTDANTTLLSEIKVRSGDVVIMPTYYRSGLASGYTGAFVDKHGDKISETQISDEYNIGGRPRYLIVPDGAEYLLVYENTSNVDASCPPRIYYMEKPYNYRDTLKFNDTPKVKLIAHRGLNGYAPEATIPAYTLAGEKGMWGVKLDVCETADGYFIMSHDSTVDRMTDGSGNISDMTLAEIEALTVDAGTNIALYPNEKLVRLEQALEICARYNMHPVMCIKEVSSNASVENILKIISDYNLTNQMIWYNVDNFTYPSIVTYQNFNIPVMYWKENYEDIATLARYTSGMKGLTNAGAIMCLNTWNTQYQNTTYINYLKSIDCPIGAAVIDGNKQTALSKANFCISHGTSFIVTSNILPEDIAPNTYSI